MAASLFINSSRYLVILMLFSTLHCPSLSADLLDVRLFSQTLSKLATDGLGVSALQEHFDKLQFTETAVDGSVLIPNLAASVSNKFKERFLVVRRLKRAVESSWTTSPTTTPAECCKIANSPKRLEYDSRFRNKVDFASLCVKVSESAPSSRQYVADSVLSEMKDIMQQYPVIKWQYFASEEGMLASFPAFEDTADCRSYDPRFRPFYVETATPEPKDVVLVIDTSGSMSDGDRIDVAKAAAKTVLSTMNPRDRIALVKFSSEAETPTGYNNDGRDCHSKRLADATPINIKYLKDFVDILLARGGTDYSKAFTLAFDLLKGSSPGKGPSRKKVILFLTDGEPNDAAGDIMQTIKTKNAELNNAVVIMTYGVLADLQILKDIAQQDGSNYSIPKAPDVPAGKFTYVSNTNNLRRDLATYYDFFSTNTIRDEPIISIPYVDTFGTGLLTSITLPCYHQGKFIGVVGTDISMADLLSEITYFQKSQSSYAFMADSSGRTMMHPLLPAPSNAYGDPIFMDITALEPEPEFYSVFESIKNGGSGQKNISSKRFLARGGQVNEGVTVVEIPSIYYWLPVEETNFTVGIVVAVGDKDETLGIQAIPSGFKFLYHRLDLIKPDDPCVHFSRYAAKDSTVVKFGAEAFKDPYAYLVLDETVSEIEAYRRFMTSTSSPNPGFKEGIRDTVIGTQKVEDIWFREKMNYTKYLVWRYIGTANGVFRMTPGTSLAKSYDPRKRPWYHTALSNKGLVALSTPYIDAFGAGVVITAAHTIYRGERSSQRTTNDKVIAVMGADFPLSYFQKLLTDTYPKCKENNFDCFVLDAAGFLIMHDDFLVPDITAKTLEYVHITEKEKDVAEDLLQKGYLLKGECRNLEKIKLQSFYELKIPLQGVNTLDSGVRCKKYQLSSVVETNAFLGIISRDSSCYSRSCTCSSNKECSNVQGLTCQCPCSSRLNFHYCRSEFPASNTSICPVPATVVPSEKVNDPSVSGLEKCFDPKCNEKTDSGSCDGVVGCYWCIRDINGVPLSNRYCADISTCHGGREGTRASESSDAPTDPDDDDDDKGGMSGGAIAGIVIGVIVAAIIVAVIIVVKCRNRQRVLNNQPAGAPPSPVPSNAPSPADPPRRLLPTAPPQPSYNPAFDES
ncbi:VWFA and cache domain-containing protein 1-like [Montipora foliosa]|uniref:VWFA and cache domain-containing protein 1-like n=1 Tax=Montipora foliosa TaxID=591990 RepID=UPI0035F1C110